MTSGPEDGIDRIPAGSSDYSKLDLSFIWIDSDSACEIMLEEIDREPRIALDLEGSSLYHYRDRISLIQIATQTRKYVIDPFSLDVGSSFKRILEADSIIKVLHGCEHDVRSLDRDYGIHIRNLYDTKVAAELCGMTSLSLAGLVEHFFGVHISKKYQTHDWSARPITPQALAYAVCDTHFLLELKDLLDSKLLELGRTDWVSEELRQLEMLRYKPSRNQMLGFRSMQGVHLLGEKSVAIAHALWEWREKTAEMRDVPPFRVMSNEVLLKIAAEKPRSIHHLKITISNNRRLIQELHTLWTLITQAPDRVPREPDVLNGCRRLSASEQQKIKQIKDRRTAIADELGINPALIASREAIERLVRLNLSLDGNSIEDIRSGTGLRQWQIQLLRRGVLSEKGSGKRL